MGREEWEIPWGVVFVFFCFCFWQVQLWAFNYFEDLLRSSYGLRVSNFLNSTQVPSSVARLLTIAEIWLLGTLIYNVDIGAITRLIPLKINRYTIYGCLIGFLFAIIIVSIRSDIDDPKNVQSVQKLLVKDAAVIYIISYMISLSVIGPLVEELLFRGLLYSWLRRNTGAIVAIFISSILFALGHGWGIKTVINFILGVFCAFLYERTRSLSISYWVHSTYNLVVTFAPSILVVLYR